MVRVSGAFEILGGLGLLVPATRRTAAWGLVALLIAVFPANLNMAMHPVEAGASGVAPVLRWERLPLRALLNLVAAAVYAASLHAALTDIPLSWFSANLAGSTTDIAISRRVWQWPATCIL